MNTIKATYQKRNGVFPEHRNAKFQGTLRASLRMTIPAREAIQRVSERVEDDDAYYFAEPPKGVIVVLAPAIEAGAPNFGAYMPAYRCTDEPPYPGERPNHDMWLDVDLTPCPVCGAALVWYEAGYVPGYRVCAGKAHHHVIVEQTL